MLKLASLVAVYSKVLALETMHFRLLDLYNLYGSGGSTVVEHLPHHPHVKVSSSSTTKENANNYS